MVFLPTISKKKIEAGMLVQSICAEQAYGYSDIFVPPLTWLYVAWAHKGRDERMVICDFYADGYVNKQRCAIWYENVVGLQKRGPNQVPVIYNWYEWKPEAEVHGLIDIRALYRVQAIDKAFRDFRGRANG